MPTADPTDSYPTMADQLSCVRCAKPLQETDRFCPFCAAEQPAAAQAGAADQMGAAAPPRPRRPLNPEASEDAPPQGDWHYAKGSDGNGPDAKGSGQPSYHTSRPSPDGRAAGNATEGSPLLVLRAGEKIWHFEEEEAGVEPGRPRPWLVVDEQVTHLSHTDRELTPEALLARVQTLLEQDRVPVRVQLLPTRWQNDGEERRPRLVASLKSHRYSDIKMLLGLDYLGRWASIHLALAIEPAPLPVPPEPEELPDNPAFQHPVGAIICLVLGFLGFIGGNALSSSNYYWSLGREFAPVLIGAGVLLGLIGAISYLVAVSNHGKRCAELRAAWQQEQARRRQAWEAEQRQRAQQNMADRLSRTFKVDDMRLFSTAMREVYRSVVDDIVSQGAQVARIEGGQGGFFEAQGVTQAVAPARQSDAASLGV